MTALLTKTIRQALFAAAVALSFAGHASASELPGGYSCSDLRSKVSEYGATLVLSMAKSHGYSDRTISQVRSKCGV